MKKKVISLLLVAAMAVSMAACGNTSTDKGSDNGGTAASAGAEASTDGDFLIGYPTAASYNAVMNAMHLNRQTIAQAAGGDLVTEIFEFDDATTIDAVEKLITDGCKGIFVTPTSNDVLYNVTDMCDEAGV